MKATEIILIFLGLCLLGVAHLVWENRGSEKIISTVIPAVLGAAAAILLAVFVFGEQPSLDATFPVAFHYVSATRLPWFAPWGIGDRWISDSYLAPGKLKEINKTPFAGNSDADGMLLYHYLLQWSVARWMSMAYGANWRSEILRFDLPDSREGSYASSRTDSSDMTVVSGMQIETMLRGNPFPTTNIGFPPTVSLPPGTKMCIKVPKSSSDAGEISLVNDLFSLVIQTTASQYKHSVGTYAKLAGLSDADDQALMKVVYLVRIKVDFNRWKSGNPMMGQYRTWTQGFLAEFRDSFDEQQVWARIRNDYMLRRQIEQLGPLK